MKVKSILTKSITIAALTTASAAALSCVSSNSAHAAIVRNDASVYHVAALTTVYNNYQNGLATGQVLSPNTNWKIIRTAYDYQGNKWYDLGKNQWVKVAANVTIPAYRVNNSGAQSQSQAQGQNINSNQSQANSAIYVNKSATPAKTGTTTEEQVSYSAGNDQSAVKQQSAASSSVQTQANRANVSEKPSYSQEQQTYAPKTQIQAVTPKTTSAPVQTSGSAASVVALAKAQAGKNYVWGATGPNSFDCSGLVQYVYKNAAGVNLPRTTYSQVNVGQTVSMNNLKAGDLLFWGSASAPYHVGIYLGNGQYANAATPSQGVRVQNLTHYYYPSVAKRVLN